MTRVYKEKNIHINIHINYYENNHCNRPQNETERLGRDTTTIKQLLIISIRQKK